MKKKAVVYLVPTLLALLWLVPYFYMLFASFKTDMQLLLEGIGFESPLTLETYRYVLSNTLVAPLGRWLLNSLIASGTAAAGYAVIVLLGSYGYSRLKFRGRDQLFLFLLLTMTIPGIVTLVPTFHIMSTLNLKNSLWALILPAFGGVSGLFLMKQFMMRLPKSEDEAAALDGAGKLTILFRIIFPQVIPALVIVMLFCFLGVWNDFLWPSIILDNYEKVTLTAGFYMLTGVYDGELASLMAAAVISSIPIILIYFIFQKRLLQGIAITSGVVE